MTGSDLIISFTVAASAVIIAALRSRKKRNVRPAFQPIPRINDPALITPPIPFGYKTAWFAIRSENTKAVATALQLQNLQPAGWTYGIWHSIETDDYSIFLTPAVHGWTLAVGTPVLYEAEDHATDRMVELSRQFGEAHLFASMRISNAYVWARARNGKLERRFYDVDGQHNETGEVTEEEKSLGLEFFEGSSPESKAPGYWARKDSVFVGEEHVLQVAGRWSVDPSKLDQMGLLPAQGLIGEASVSYRPKPQPIRR
jgi:hypothetical protein